MEIAVTGDTRRVCTRGFPNGKDFMGVDGKLH